MSTKLVTVNDASFGYNRKADAVVEGVQFTVSSGDFIVLRGPNGCGKSTIIKGILGLTITLKGSVTWSIALNRIGYVPQENSISSGIPYTAFDIVQCGIDKSEKDSRDRIHHALAAVEMSAYSQVRFGSLSGGQKRRVLFARALVGNPGMLILDEPTANVDLHTEKVIEQRIDTIITKHKAAVIAVTHAVDFAGKAQTITVGEGKRHE